MRKFFNKIATKIKSSKKLMVGATVATVVAISAVPAFAEDAVDPTVTAMQTAFDKVGNQGVSAIAVIAPTAILVFGAFCVWKWGTKFFKSIAK